MHWRFQKILHGLSHFRHALTDKYPPGAGTCSFSNPQALARSLGLGIQEKPGGLVEINDGGNKYLLRNEGSDVAVFHEIFVKGEYWPLVNFLKMNGISVRTVVDAGANIGLASRYFFTEFEPERILCLEPYGPSFDVARLNLEAIPGVQLLNKAVWGKPVPQLHLHRHFRDGHDWAVAATEKEGSLSAGTTQAITLNEIIHMPGFESIDLLKVDIEGGEQEIFDPAANTDFLEKVKVICVELHREVPGYRKIFKTFKRHGFVLMETGDLVIGVRVKGM